MNLRREDLLCGVLSITIGILGLLSNSLLILMLFKKAKVQTFSRLLISRLVANLLVLIIFVFWSGPMILIGRDFNFLPISSAPGAFASFAYNSITYLEPFIAFNRMMAVYSTFGYNTYCNMRKTTLQIGVAWLLAGCAAAPELFPTCNYSFSYSTLSWSYVDSKCASIMDYAAFLIPAYSSHAISLILNFVVMCTLCHRLFTNHIYNEEETRRQYRRNVRNFIQETEREYAVLHAETFQTVLQFCLFSSDLLSNTFRDQTGNRLEDFVSFVLTWELVHVLDSFIVWLFLSPSWSLFKNTRLPDVTVVRVSSYTKHDQ